VSSTGVSDQDIRRMMAIATYDGGTEGDGLPWEVLQLLKELVACDCVSVSGQDTPNWEFFLGQELPDQQWSPSFAAPLLDAYREHYWTSTCSYPDSTGDVVRVTRSSDLLSDRAYRHTGMYADFDRLVGLEHEIRLCLDTGTPQRTVRLIFSRGSGSDFTDRDLAVLTLLRPHLQAAFAAAERRRRRRTPLTARQREILRYVAAGYTNGQISRRLAVSEATVRKHLENIFSRLGVSNRTAAVAQLDPPL
jgi:DNA-binding CsgD family transcriptional regulator